MDIPNFETKKETLQFLVSNKAVLIAEKKATIKHADGYLNVLPTGNGISKANTAISNPPDLIQVKAIINTTNLMDSHDDVHITGLWTKSLEENKNLMHLQEHRMSFDKIIADGEDLDAYTRTYNWRDLGFKFEGSTQALVFESKVKKSRNEFMHKEYANGHVKQHSVGMQYVKLVLAVNDEEWGAEFEAWEKYINEVANFELAESKGYFWAVKEAKVIEGSAVPLGSNVATPTLDNNFKEPSSDTQIEPVITTHKTIILPHF